MSELDRQLKQQGGRCFWCSCILLHYWTTRDHLYPRRRQARATHGGAWVLACERCNRARSALSIGSLRFNRWIKRVLRGDIRRWSRPENLSRLSRSRWRLLGEE